MNTAPNVLVAVIDTQIDFMMANGLLPVPGAEAIIAPGIRFLSELDPTEVAAVLFTHDTHHAATFYGSPENIGDEAAGIQGFPMHCEQGTPGWENVFNPAIVPNPIGIHTLTKGVFDMWAEPALTDEDDDGRGWIDHADDPGSSTARDVMLGSPNGTRGSIQEHGVDTVRLIGVASDFCVNWAIVGFLARGYKVQVVEHLTAGIGMDMRATVEANYPGRVEFL
jgi:nicotinamidase/pyrazinamidase